MTDWDIDNVLDRLKRRGTLSIADVSDWYLVKGPSERLKVAAVSETTELISRRPSRTVQIPPWVVRPVAKRGGPIFAPRMTLGRSPECDIVLEFSFISKHHATLGWENGRLHVVDEDSANGTWIDDIPLDPGERGVLEAGHRLRLGALDLVLVTSELLEQILVGRRRRPKPGA